MPDPNTFLKLIASNINIISSFSWSHIYFQTAMINFLTDSFPFEIFLRSLITILLVIQNFTMCSYMQLCTFVSKLCHSRASNIHSLETLQTLTAKIRELWVANKQPIMSYVKWYRNTPFSLNINKKPLLNQYNEQKLK